MTLQRVFLTFMQVWSVAFYAVGQQGYTQISGIVQDKKTGEPLPLASIRIASTGLGTVSNQQGEFDFNVPLTMNADTLVISYVGYRDVKKIASEAASGGLEYFLLEENITELDQVIIVDGESYAEGIVNKAITQMKDVFPSDEFILDAFYREWEIRHLTSDDKERANIVEAAIRIADSGYNPKTPKFLKETVYLLELRKSIAAEGNVEGTEFGWLLRQNPVNYRKAKGHFFIPGVLDMPNELGYEYKNTVIFGDEELHVITAEAYDFLATYTLYISTKDYALLRVDLQAKSTEQKFIHHNPSDPRFRMLFIDNTLRFRRIDGKPYLDYMRMHWEWEKYDSLTGREEEGELYKELVVNDVFADPAKVDVVKRQMKTAAITPGESLYEKARPYDAIFWSYYNVIKDNPLNTRLQRALDASGKTFEQSLD